MQLLHPRLYIIVREGCKAAKQIVLVVNSKLRENAVVIGLMFFFKAYMFYFQMKLQPDLAFHLKVP